MRSELYVMVFTKRLGLYRRARMVTFSAPSSNYYRPRSRIIKEKSDLFIENPRRLPRKADEGCL
jgi:hypothetical protein